MFRLLFFIKASRSDTSVTIVDFGVRIMNEEVETIEIINGIVYFVYDDGTVIANGSATTMTQ